MYTHLSHQDRITIGALRRQGHSPGDIAADIGKSVSTVRRELNRCPPGRYDPNIAHRQAKKKRRDALSKRRKMTPEVCLRFLAELQRTRSVYSASKSPDIPVGMTTLYKYLDARACEGSHMKPPRPRKKALSEAPFIWMRFGPKHYRKRPKGARGKRFAMMRDAANIAERPDIADMFLELGHWEVDTMHWGKGVMSLTLRERKSGLTLLGVLPACSADAVADLIIKMLDGLPVKTITSDGGWEFVRWRRVESALGAKWYVCDRASPWQRGGVEGANGIVRGIVKADIAAHGLSAALRIAQDVINHRETRRLGDRTPAEVIGL